MQWFTEEDYFFIVEELSDPYFEISNQLMYQYQSLLGIHTYSIDISSFYCEDEESPPKTMEEILHRLYNFPEDDKQIIRKTIQKEISSIHYSNILEAALEQGEDAEIAFNVYIDRDYTKYKKEYKKRFQNDNLYQLLDQLAPEYVGNLCMSSTVLENGTRCDIFLSGFLVENFETMISTINHQYFIDQIKVRKKLNIL